MNLEAVEQKCLAYLMQVSRPVVSLDRLLRHLHRDTETADVSERDLLDFLRNHELFTVLDPIGLAADPAGAKTMEEAGVSVGPSVILETRVPTKRQLAEQMNEQLDLLVASLETATEEAQQMGDEARCEQLALLRARINSLKKRLGQFE